MLLLRPALARFGDGVRLPHLLAGVVPRRGDVGMGLLRRRRAGRDHEGNQAPAGDSQRAVVSALVARVEVQDLAGCEQLPCAWCCGVGVAERWVGVCVGGGAAG